MARTTRPILFLTYSVLDDPLVRDLYARVERSNDPLFEELTPEARLQLARHLRELALDIETGRAVHPCSRALLLNSEAGPRLAYKDHP